MTDCIAPLQALAEVWVAVEERDFEKAASKEHDFYVAVFTAIIEDPTDASYLAEFALIVAKSNFPRW